MAKVAIQGGVKNYLPSKEVTVPKKAKSSKSHPITELAYITKAEKDLLIKKDLHNSLNGKPNKGPGGIISLNGDYDGGPDRSPGNTGSTGPGSQGDFRSNAQHTSSKADYSRDRTVRGDTSAFKDTGTGKYELSTDPTDQQAVNNYVLGKMAYQKGKKPSFFGGPGSLKQRQQVYDKQRALGWAAQQRARKVKGIDDLIAETYVANPHMDISEIRDALMAQYDATNKTMKGLEGFNTGKLGMNYGPTQLGPLGLNTKNVKGETMSTDYLSTTPSLDSRLNSPGILGFALDKLQGKTSVNNLMSSIDRINQIDTMVDKGITQTDINDYYDKAQGKGKYDIFGGGGDGGGPQPYLPFDYNTGAATTETVEPYTNDFTYRFGNDQDVIYDNYGTQGYRTTASEGGIMGTRARRAMGGIMNRIDKRQQFFLGGIGKAVGKVVGGVAKAAGKVLSSDVGKMAIAGLGAYYMAGGTGLGGAKMFGNTAKSTFMGNLGRVGTYIKNNPFKTIGLASAALPFLMPPAKPNEDIGMGERGGRLLDSKGNESLPAGLRAEVQEAYASGDSEKIKDIQKYYSFLPSPDLVNLPGTEMFAPYTNYGSQGYRTTVATGGRIGYNGGGSVITLMDGTKVQIPAGSYNSSGSLKDRIYSSSKGDLLREEIVRKLSFANGGRIGKAEGGLMDLGGMEKDYRAEGGFVPIGEYEKKDDVPARLSVNEFVFTADAVRGAGQGDIDKGAEIMENMMENLENGGTVSEESQGNKGAQNMFKTSERLGAVI